MTEIRVVDRSSGDHCSVEDQESFINRYRYGRVSTYLPNQFNINFCVEPDRCAVCYDGVSYFQMKLVFLGGTECGNFSSILVGTINFHYSIIRTKICLQIVLSDLLRAGSSTQYRYLPTARRLRYCVCR